ncbi:uncharacterized protein LOC119633922 isoform X1 [Glossina fuscipes]|uniref:Uncharacterized protein LOC119633922 isoform X1 n=1 Tax=Glossina fuscipes TaxID=7396 RepID=A0A8U0WFJ1_9MUSC|nr:uncharacterized protein LOC119633922 isoform X1 [Glossina fuscipes]KAI9590446.1 hypothetical protein GQX74_008613 [Glossina fuscipes]
MQPQTKQQQKHQMILHQQQRQKLKLIKKQNKQRGKSANVKQISTLSLENKKTNNNNCNSLTKPTETAVDINKMQCLDTELTINNSTNHQSLSVPLTRRIIPSHINLHVNKNANDLEITPEMDQDLHSNASLTSSICLDNVSMQPQSPSPIYQQKILQQQYSHSSYQLPSRPSHLVMNGISSGSDISSGTNSPVLSSSSSSSSSNVSTQQSLTPSIGVNLRVTGQCSQGGRKYMEDYFSVAYQQSENAKDLEYAFIGIYDGHGGAEAATFAKEHLMMEIIKQKLFWSDSDQDILRAIREGYIATHYSMWREQEKWPKTANGLPSTAGTTATIAFIRREKIYIGHVGDSGIVLGYQNDHENFWRAKQLTVDHKPESLEERTRIMKSGGKVVVKSGVPRVVWNRPRNANHRGPIRKKTLIDEIPFLAVARSLGDLWSYNSENDEFVVSPDPDVKVIPIDSQTFRCLIFGTDGLWNVVSAQEAVNLVREKEVINERLQAQHGDAPNEGVQWTNPSKSLVEKALKTWSAKKMRADNTSVVTVILYPPGKGVHNHADDAIGIRREICTLTTAPMLMKPMYSIEQAEINADVTSCDDATTYKEMAMKHLPPIEYRNFDYYAEDSEGENEIVETDETETEDFELLPKLSTIAQSHDYPADANTWSWQSTSFATEHVAQMQEESDEEMNKEEHEVSVINYQNYLHHDNENANAEDSYLNSFSQSYSTLLQYGERMEEGEMESVEAVEDCNSSWSITSVTGSHIIDSPTSSNSGLSRPDMHEIIKEQQLYQAQCMSQEEGYSLTKLETRREQQGCKTHETGVQTLSIVRHQTTQMPDEVETYTTRTQPSIQQVLFHLPSTSYVTTLQQKPLEFHSLLQQEREEEQLVALERQQMLKLSEQNIAEYSCLQALSHNVTSLNQAPSQLHKAYKETPLVEEYLDEHDEFPSGTSDADTSVQIHEVSSSNCSEVSDIDSSSEKDIALEETDEEASDSCSSREIMPEVNVTPEKHTSVRNKRPLIAVKNILLIKNSKSSQCVPNQTKYDLLKVQGITRERLRSRTFYPNRPNENLKRISSKHSSCNLLKSSSNLRKTFNSSNTATNKAQNFHASDNSTPKIEIKRELRSNSTKSSEDYVDYSKRTLRARNTMAKDMKAKAALVAAALKYPNNAVSRDFLRSAAATFRGNKNVLISDYPCTPSTNRRALTIANPIRNKTHKQTGQPAPSLTKVPPHPPVHALNLRSRQVTMQDNKTKITPLSTNRSTASVTTAALRQSTKPLLKHVSFSERRTLRSMLRNDASKSSITDTSSSTIATSFSKSTRSQSIGSNLAAPPPSPKLMNAAAAVAAATRARCLLSAKKAAEVNGTQPVLKTIFGKRTSPRVSTGVSNSPSLSPVVNNKSEKLSTVPDHTLRGRVVKRLKR